MFSGISSKESCPPSLSPDLCEGEAGDGADGGPCEGGGGGCGDLLPILGACGGVLGLGSVRRGGQINSELLGGGVSDVGGGGDGRGPLAGVAGGPGLGSEPVRIVICEGSEGGGGVGAVPAASRRSSSTASPSTSPAGCSSGSGRWICFSLVLLLSFGLFGGVWWGTVSSPRWWWWL